MNDILNRRDAETQRIGADHNSFSSLRICASAVESSFRSRNRFKHRRGAIFIVALGITVVLSAMLLVYAQQMRTESLAAANRVAMAQADAVEQGAEQWSLAQVEANVAPLTTGGLGGGTTGGTSTSTLVDPTTIPAEALQVGGGYFWILHPDPTQDQLYGFGLVDESSKINLNTSPTILANELVALPNMTTDIATNISNWAATAMSTGPASYETVEQLMLVDNMTELTPQVLYGYDLNHDGVISTAERNLSGGSAVTNGTTEDARGIYQFVTAFSTYATPGTVGSTAPTRTAPMAIGMINVNTASAQVLAGLPGMSTATAQTMIAQRTTSAPALGDTSWVSTALGQTLAGTLTPYITGISYQYSADIVAVSGDGRAFKRVLVVVDARTQPARIMYRKDLTSLGWPLPADVRTSLQQGKGIPADVTGTTNKQTSGGVTN